MRIVPLQEKMEKLCFRSSGDVVQMQDGSGPYMVGAVNQIAVRPRGSSGLFETTAREHITLIRLGDGVDVSVHLSTRVIHYPMAAVHLGKGE